MNMKKRLSPAKSPLPKFQSDEEAAEYFENHSVAGVWDQLHETHQAKPLPALAKKIRDRHARAKSPISLRLAPEHRDEAHRGSEVRRLPDATPNVDCRGDPPGSEARLTSSRPHRGSGLVTLASNYTPCRRVGSAHKSPIARAFPGPNLRLW